MSCPFCGADLDPLDEDEWQCPECERIFTIEEVEEWFGSDEEEPLQRL